MELSLSLGSLPPLLLYVKELAFDLLRRECYGIEKDHCCNEDWRRMSGVSHHVQSLPRRSLRLIVLGLLLAATGASADITGRVVSVTDGDTIKVLDSITLSTKFD